MTTRIDVQKLAENIKDLPNEQLYARYDYCILTGNIDAAKILGAEIISRVGNDFQQDKDHD